MLTLSSALTMWTNTTTKTRFALLARLFLAVLVLAVARYSVWFIHEQHLARARSFGRSETYLRDIEAPMLCRMASMHDWLLDTVRPAHDYFQRYPARRDALVQTMSVFEALLLLFNIWLFVVADLWVIVQCVTAFSAVLGLQAIWWSPMPCDAIILPPSDAWVSNLLAGGNVLLPLGGISGSTVFVVIALHNVWMQRRHLDTAFMSSIGVGCYILYHLLMRWHYTFDELCSVLLAVVVVQQVKYARSLFRFEALVKQVQSKAEAPSEDITRATTPNHDLGRGNGISVMEAYRAYHTNDQIQTQGDAFEDEALPARPTLADIQIYGQP